MKITVFAKKRTMQKEDGKVKIFWNFLTTLRSKSGDEFIASVKFRDECGEPKPETCPINIEFDKRNANLTDRKYIDKEGVEQVAKTLWLSSWKESDDVYVDHSLDDFE